MIYLVHKMNYRTFLCIYTICGAYLAFGLSFCLSVSLYANCFVASSETNESSNEWGYNKDTEPDIFVGEKMLMFHKQCMYIIILCFCQRFL